MKTYPICLIGLENRRVVVVGGGEVAARKVETLLEAGAPVVVISPLFCDEFNEIRHRFPGLQTVQREYRRGDVDSAWIVIAATDQPAVNQAIWEDASANGCLVNVVDDPGHSNFILPAILRRGEVTLAVSTGGSSPALAHRLRVRLEQEFGPEYGELAALLAELRPELMTRFAPGKPRLHAALSLVDSDLLEIIRDKGISAARQKARRLLLEASGEETH